MKKPFAQIGVSLGQPIVVENMSGAGGIIAMEHMRRASPMRRMLFLDGHIPRRALPVAFEYTRRNVYPLESAAFSRPTP